MLKNFLQINKYQDINCAISTVNYAEQQATIVCNQNLILEAKSHSAEQLLVYLLSLSEKQLECISLFPTEILRDIIQISPKNLHLIARTFGKCLEFSLGSINTVGILSSIDKRINKLFFHYYNMSLYSYEPTIHAVSKNKEDQLGRQILHFNTDMARRLYLRHGINDAIKQTKENSTQQMAIKIGISSELFLKWWPKYSIGDFKKLKHYIGSKKTCGRNEVITDKKMFDEYISLQKLLKNKYDCPLRLKMDVWKLIDEKYQGIPLIMAFEGLLAKGLQ